MNPDEIETGLPGENLALRRYLLEVGGSPEERNTAALDRFREQQAALRPGSVQQAQDDPIRETLRSLGFERIPEQTYRDLNAEADAVAARYRALTDQLAAAQQVAPKVTESRTLQTSTARKSSSTSMVRQSPQEQLGLSHEIVKDLRERMFIDPDSGRPFIFETGTIKEASDAREQGANVLRLSRIADRIRELEGIVDSRVYARTRDALIQQAATTISKLQGQGAMTDDERKAYDDMFKSVPLFGEQSRGGANALRAWVEQYNNFHTALVRKLGVREVDPRFYRKFIANPGASPGGRLVPERLVNLRAPDGSPVAASLEDAAALVREGYSVDPDQPEGTVQLRTPQGTVDVVPSQLGQYLGDPRVTLATRAEQQREQAQQIYGGAAGERAAALAGLARGLTFGLSDQYLATGEPQTAEDLAALQRANPSASLGGELAGALTGGALLSGGFGAAGTLASRGASSLGAGARAAEVLGTGARLAAEGAVFGASQEVSRAAIEQRAIRPGAALESAGHGALVALALGAGISLAGRGLGRAAEAFGGGAGSGPGSLRETLATKVLGAQKRQIRAFEQGSFEATGARARAVELAESVALKSPEEKAALLAAEVERSGARVGELIDDLSARGAKLDVAPVAEKLQAEIGALRARSGPEYARAVRDLEAWAEEFATKGASGDARELWKFKKDLGDATTWESRLESFGSPAERAKREVYREINRVFDSAGKTLGDDGFSAAWRTANRDFQAARWAAEAVGEKVAQKANRLLGLSEQIGLSAGGAAGAILGGSPVSALVGGALLGGVQRLVKTYGADVALAALSGARGGGAALSRLTAGLVDRGIDSAVAGSVRAAARAQTSSAGGSGPSRPEGASQAARPGPAAAVLFDDPGAPPGSARRLAPAVRQYLALASAPRDPGDPAAQTAARISSALARVVPVTGNLRSTLTPRAEEPKLSTAQQRAVEQAFRYAGDPLAILDDAASGTLRRSDVELFEELAPELLAEIRARLSERLAERTEPLPYQAALRLSLLLGVAGHPALSPETISEVQAALAPLAPQRQTAAEPEVRRRPLDLNLSATLTSQEDQL